MGRSSIQNDLKWLRETFPTNQIESCKGRYGTSGSGTDFMKSLMVFNIYGVRKMTYCIDSSLINLEFGVRDFRSKLAECSRQSTRKRSKLAECSRQSARKRPKLAECLRQSTRKRPKLA